VQVCGNLMYMMCRSLKKRRITVLINLNGLVKKPPTKEAF
jgi:hypothetical protein